MDGHYDDGDTEVGMHVSVIPWSASRVFLLVLALLVVRLETAAASNCLRVSIGSIPLSDLGTGLYLGRYQGGLYPNGANVLPAAHLTAGLSAAAAVVPRNSAGVADLRGKIVLLSVGMSNTTMEFCSSADGSTCTPDSFMSQAAANPAVDHEALVIVNGAHGGEPAGKWLDPAGDNYERVATQLAARGLSELQVQVVWVKQANPGPTVGLPAAGADAYTLERELAMIARTLKVRYPNLQQVFYSSRIYAGYASTALNPEPYAYESGFAVKWLIEAQIKQMASPGKIPDARAGDLNYDTVAPWLAWGPYLWADGERGRSDGLSYACTDLLADGTHPARGAIQKVAGALLDFFLGEPVTSPWFATNGSGGTTTTTVPPSATELTLFSVGSQDGIVIESSEGSGEGGVASTQGNLRVGDDSGARQVRTIVSFNTSAIPDGASIVGATLLLRRSGISGMNPFDILGAAYVDVSRGGFGGSATLLPGDFQAAATAPGAAGLTRANANGEWSEGQLVPDGLEAISKTGITQLRIEFAIDDDEDGIADSISYQSGESVVSDRPRLIVTYAD